MRSAYIFLRQGGRDPVADGIQLVLGFALRLFVATSALEEQAVALDISYPQVTRG